MGPSIHTRQWEATIGLFMTLAQFDEGIPDLYRGSRQDGERHRLVHEGFSDGEADTSVGIEAELDVDFVSSGHRVSGCR